MIATALPWNSPSSIRDEKVTMRVSGGAGWSNSGGVGSFSGGSSGSPPGRLQYSSHGSRPSRSPSNIEARHAAAMASVPR
jgi:hypothetical protein